MAAIIFSVLSVVLLAMAFSRPFWGLYLLTITLIAKPAIFHPIFIQLHMTRLVGILVLIMVIFQGKKHKLVPFFKYKQNKLLLLLYILMGCSLLTSIWGSNSLSAWLEFIKVMIAYYLIINLTTTVKELWLLIWAMLLSTFYIACMSVRGYYSGEINMADERMFGVTGALFGDPNDLAFGLVVMLPFIYFGVTSKFKVHEKALLLFMSGTFLWAIILTQSRGGFIALSAMLLALWSQTRQKFISLIVLLVIAIGGWQLAPASFKERMSTIKTAGQRSNIEERDPAAISRMDAWKAGINMMKSRVFGVGMGNFGEGFFHYRPLDAVDLPGMRRAAHSMFFEIGGETGFPGFIVFILLIISAMKALVAVEKKTRRSSDRQVREINTLCRATLVSLMGYLAGGTFLSQSYNFVLYYLIAFSIVLQIIYEKQCSIESVKTNEKRREN